MNPQKTRWWRALSVSGMIALFIPAVASSAVAEPDGGPVAFDDVSTKPRVVAMTDGEIDDWSTMVRFLMYSSDFDIAGIVQENSIFQQQGHSVEGWLDDELDAYAAVYDNLIVHNPEYPTPEYLRSVSVVGNETTGDLVLAPSEMTTRDTEGERLIIDALTDDDPRPIIFGAWGGANTLAQALWTIKTTHSEADWEKAVAKTRLYAIWYQDNGGRWIEENLPEIQVFEAFRWDTSWNYRVLEGTAPDSTKEMMNTDWLYENIKTNHGPLGEFYPQEYTSEGDTPAFLNAVNNGLNEGYEYADFTLGGWAGRADLDEPYMFPNHYTDRYNISDDGDSYKQYWRWLPAVQNDWAARADWMVADSYEDANHNPLVTATGPTRGVVQPGDTFTMDLSNSTDPDGDSLSFNFWHYGDQDSVEANIEISQDGSGIATFVVPDEPGTQLQIVAEVTDDGEPALTTYQRYLVGIGTEYVKASAERPADSIDWSAPETISDDSDVLDSGTLVRAVNLTSEDKNSEVSVNGVTFEPSPYIGGTTSVGGADEMFATDSAPISGQLDRILAGASKELGSTDGSFAGLSKDYRSLLETGFYNNADETVTHSFYRFGNFSIPERYTERAGYELTLNGLVPGQQYAIQLFVNDSSTERIGDSANPNMTTIVRDFGGETELRHNEGMNDSIGQFVVGTFTADASSKVIQFIGGPGKGSCDQRSAVLNAYQLREVGAEVVVPSPGPLVVDRLSGADRYATSLQVARQSVKEGGKVVVVAGDSFADSISAAPLAQAMDAALVLVRPDRVDAAMVGLLKDREVSAITIVGGPATVSSTVETQLNAATNVTAKRIFGIDRYATSQDVLSSIASLKGKLEIVAVATGRAFPDSITAAAFASGFEGATLLVPGNGHETQGAITTLAKEKVSKVSIIGGPASIDSQTFTAIKNAIPNTTRIGGTDRYDTSLKVNAEINKAKGAENVSRIWFATGTVPPDALVASAALQPNSERLYLSTPNCAPVNIRTTYPQTTHVTLIGGEKSLTNNVYKLNTCN